MPSWRFAGHLITRLLKGTLRKQVLHIFWGIVVCEGWPRAVEMSNGGEHGITFKQRLRAPLFDQDD
jgi:hypothetical protein